MWFSTTVGDGNYTLLGDSSNTFFNAPSGGTMYFRNNNLDKMVINSSGNVGIGTASPSARLHTISTTEQLRLGYDASNYFSTTVSSTGTVTFDSVGSGASFIFVDPVEAPTVKATNAGGFVSSDGSTGATGSFLTADAKTVTVKDGIIVSIV